MVVFLLVLDKIIVLFEILIFARVILSWLPLDHNSSLVHFIYAVTEPILSPVRAMIQRSIFGGRGQMLDFSPFFVYLFLTLIQGMIR